MYQYTVTTHCSLVSLLKKGSFHRKDAKIAKVFSGLLPFLAFSASWRFLFSEDSLITAHWLLITTLYRDERVRATGAMLGVMAWGMGCS